MSLIDKQLTGETPRAGTMIHGITAGGIARPVLVNDDGTVNTTGSGGGGGGTEYTEGDTDASITGGAVMMEVAANTLQPVQGTVADGLLVNLGSNNDVTVTGSVTANAGTGFPTLDISEALSATSYDLNASSYAASSSLTSDYILDHIQFTFTTTQSRDITVTASDGSKIWSAIGDTSLHITLEDLKRAFNANSNFTITVTQTAGACSMSLLANVIQGSSSLAGNPLLDPASIVNTRSADSPSVDAFSRLRVSNPHTIFDSRFRYDLQPVRFNAITANSGAITHLPNESSAQLATAASAGSSAILQSRQYHRYIPGKSHLVIITGVMRTAVANVVKRMGTFDANDGIFLEQNGTTDVAVVRRTSTSGSPVDNRVTQANWNIDKMDGTGTSGITLDLTKATILVIDYQWLGMGRVRIGFNIDGLIYYVHQFLNANTLTTVYMKRGDLPIRWEAAGNGVATMQATCSTVISEGGSEEDNGFIISKGTELTARTFTAGTPLPVIAIRPSATFNSLDNHIGLLLESWSWLPTSGTNDFRWQIIWNPTITGGSWVAVDATYSAAEYNITGTELSGGVVIASGYDNASSAQRTQQIIGALSNRYPWCVDAAGNKIVIALVMTEVSGSSSVQASIQWKELR